VALIKPRVIVADDSQAFLEKLTSLLAAEFDIVATAKDGKTALDLIRRHLPDMAVLDLYMPSLSGIAVARELARSIPDLPVVICSMEIDPDIVDAVRNTHAEYILKMRIDTDLITVLKSAALRNLSSAAGSMNNAAPQIHASPTP
jgi:DNA-binding NarL/FixJ family response regulator